jgi:non-canonical purine NTP pyrophosphatase (RdgB/HAM1 family)
MHEIHFATGNADKFRLVSGLLPISVRQVVLDLPERQALDAREVIEAKARDAYRQLGKPVLVQDTALHVEAWGGLPGALVAWFLQTVGNEGICRMMRGWENGSADRAAVAVFAVGFYDGTAFRCFTSEIAGQIVDGPRGEGGFGWDPIFAPDGYDKTFAEMTDEERAAVSMRRRAFEQFGDYLVARSQYGHPFSRRMASITA